MKGRTYNYVSFEVRRNSLNLTFNLNTRTLLVALSLACLEMSFNVKGPGAVILLFRLEYKTSVVCHNVYTQKVKIARREDCTS